MGAAASSSSLSTSVLAFFPFNLSSSLTVGEKLCAALIPFAVLVEVLIHSLSSCFDAHDSRPVKPVHTFDDVRRLARNSPFSVNEVEALLELFNKLSSSIIDDGLIHKEELQLALLNSVGGENLFLNKVFDLFDEKQNGVIEFEEFVHVLSIFHPSAPMAQKIDFSFRLYDFLKNRVQEMIVATLKETGIHLSDEVLEKIIDNTFADADADMDGRINQEEWRNFVIQRPQLLKNMTLPSLRDVTAAFPSFIFNTGVDDELMTEGGSAHQRHL
ncbi:hypothetical protein L1987_47694 [Smallanthus sonchifolius]|uniref:Uncharacterized protein n=1 Tax=Smallanthus sonchifolius TaxID=185202 RepID=A0ACB9G3S4_9ASTR|nr:hypothetical protein L1987_47694 [Smallanthus sonchifolius]